jgi:hypothetical protein
MREHGFTLTKHNPDRPSMFLAGEHRTIKQPDNVGFFSWARERWPSTKWGSVSRFSSDRRGCGDAAARPGS